MNYIQIDETSICDGPGVRVVLWVSGCSVHCHGCHNPESWAFDAGNLFDQDAEKKLFTALNRPYIQGITLSGGHPLEPYNCHDVYILIQDIKKYCPNKNIWLYTGYTLSINDFLENTSEKNKIIRMCDVVVDGPYIESQRDVTLKFRGSSNQRLINVGETIHKQEIVTIQN